VGDKFTDSMEKTSLEELPSVIATTDDGVHGWAGQKHRQAVSAELQIRLTRMLTAAIDKVVDASNSNTKTMGRLTAVGVGLTATIAGATVVGTAFSMAIVWRGYEEHVYTIGSALSLVVVFVGILLAWCLWPRDGQS
jgi:hypothetical protein